MTRLRRVSAALLLSFAAVVSAPAQAPRSDAAGGAADLEWPSPPAAPRLRYLDAITGRPKATEGTRFAKVLRFLLGIDWRDADGKRLVYPTGLFARAGTVYVADPGARGVFRYDEKLGSGRWLDVGRDPKLVSPVAVAGASDGRLFVADSALGRVLILSAEGRKLGELRGDPAGLGRPAGLAVAADRVYVSDVRGHRISAYGLDGAFRFAFDGRGPEGDGLNFPTYLWYDSAAKRLWVCDSGNFRVRTFDLEGRPVGAFGENGDRPGYLARPRGVALDSDGDVYVVDGAMEALQIFDGKGRLLLFVGREGGRPGEFSLPGGVFVDGGDRVLMADTYNGRVQIFQYLKAAGQASAKENGL